MQTPEIILGAIVLVPILLLMLLRINAALVFLSLCLGDVLVRFVASDATSFSSLFSAHNIDVNQVASPNNAIALVLLLLPVLLTAVFMVKTVAGPRLVLNVFPAMGVGLLGSLLVVPLLSPGLSHNIVDAPLWTQVEHSQDMIVGVSALFCLLVLWLQRPKTGGEGKHGKKHH